MPNWCSNNLHVEGPKESLDTFETLLKTGEGDLDFNLFIPYPKRYKALDDIAKEVTEKLKKEAGNPYHIDWSKIPKDGYNQGGYDWCISNWGTKWNACEASIDRTSDVSMSGWFDTAWSPPLGVLKAMSEKFPDLKFELNYSEEGMGFKGTSVYLGGEEIEALEEYITYDEDEEEEE